MCKRIVVFGLFFLFLTFGTARTDTIWVTHGRGTIQTAIDGAKNGDVINVGPGIYVENIDFKGKAITVKSLLRLAATIDGSGARKSVVTFQSGEGAGSSLVDFAIINGTVDSTTPNGANGGGIYCKNSSPTITGNNIMGNVASFGWGGAICCENSSPSIIRNDIYFNRADYGGAISCDENSAPLIEKNWIFMNRTVWFYGGGIYCNGVIAGPAGPVIRKNFFLFNSSKRGGGIYCTGPNSYKPIIINNKILGNMSTRDGGGGICVYKNCDPQIDLNTIVANRSAKPGGGIYFSSGSTMRLFGNIIWRNVPDQVFKDAKSRSDSVTYCNIQGGWPGTGNIDLDPLFVDAGSHDYHLTYNSPCRNAGDNGSVSPDLLEDIEGDPRIADGIVDMGADEFHAHLYTTGDAVPGGQISFRVTGTPYTPLVTLALGSGVKDPPMPTPFGDFWLTRILMN